MLRVCLVAKALALPSLMPTLLLTPTNKTVAAAVAAVRLGSGVDRERRTTAVVSRGATNMQPILALPEPCLSET